MEKFYKKFAFDFRDVEKALLFIVMVFFNANVNAQVPAASIAALISSTPNGKILQYNTATVL